MSSQDNKKNKQKKPGEYPEEFEQAWSAYPKRAGGNSKAGALKAWNARIAEGAEPGELIAGVNRYAAFVRDTGKAGTEYVKQAATFFGPNEHYREDWAAPKVNGAEPPPWEGAR